MAAYVYGDKKEKYLKELEQNEWFLSDYDTSIKMNYPENGLQSVLFERTQDGVTEYAYVYAGTNSLVDAIEDIVQLAGFSLQYHVAISNARILSNEIGDNELTFVGHSLGEGKP